MDGFHALAAQKTVPTHARTNIAGIGDAAARTWRKDKTNNQLDAYVRILAVGIAFSNWTCSAKCVPDREGKDGVDAVAETEKCMHKLEVSSRFGLPNVDYHQLTVSAKWISNPRQRANRV